MNILIVDGHLGIAELIEPLLVSSGHRPRTMSRKDALGEASGREGFDACVIDLDAERDDGNALLRGLRGLARAPKIVAWTASRALWDSTRHQKLYDAFLPKPASFAMLLAALEERPCPVCGASMDSKVSHSACSMAPD